MTTQGATYKGARLYVETTETTEVEIENLISTPSTGNGTPAKIDKTNLTSSAREYKKGLPDMPDLTFGLRAMPVWEKNSNTKLLLFGGLSPNKAYVFKMILPEIGFKWQALCEWDYAPTGEGAVDTMVDGTLTLYALGTPVKTLLDLNINIIYDLNGGTGTAPKDDVVYSIGDFVKLEAGSLMTPPVGKVFQKWGLNADGTGLSYSPADEIQVFADTTFYALWSV
ncbi:MAG: InlB B-repeat-containing protein [Clostridia bacterium]